MWCQALVRCSLVLQSPRTIAKSFLYCPRLRIIPVSRSALSTSENAVFLHSHTHRYFFSTIAKDHEAGNVTSAAATSSRRVPGSESPGDKFVMIYTCNVCETRSAKTISKHAYYNGVVLVRCPDCEKLHLIADRLGWFEDTSTDIETLLEQKDEKVRFVTDTDLLELTENDILGNRKNE